MSASLVGSEMCIRDRAQRVRRHARCLHVRARTNAHLSAHVSARARACAGEGVQTFCECA
eukprot:3451336-Alexandrium_andersonii.AAC.1